jgi:clathrin heavy chain
LCFRGPEAIQVLLEHLENMERAIEFAAYWDQPDVWSILGKAQLDKELVKEAIVSFLKADDASHFVDVIAASKNANAFDDLILYLKMARVKVKDVKIDNELLYAYARVDRLADLEDFLAASNIAKVGYTPHTLDLTHYGTVERNPGMAMQTSEHSRT